MPTCVLGHGLEGYAPMSASKQSGYDDFDRPTMFEAHRSLGHDQFLELILG